MYIIKFLKTLNYKNKIYTQNSELKVEELEQDLINLSSYNFVEIKKEATAETVEEVKKEKGNRKNANRK